MSNDYPQVFEEAMKIHEQLNSLFPKLNCGKFSEKEEAHLQHIYNTLNKLNQENLDLMYPSRKSVGL